MNNPKLRLIDRLLRNHKKIQATRVNKSLDPVSLKKGTDFESFVVSRFNKNYFSLVEWRSDKNVDGIYPLMSKFPDLEFYFESQNEHLQFAVECKWRENFQAHCITLKESHLENYRYYEETTQIPTFLILGVGNTSSNPNVIYVIPLKHIESPKLHEFTLEPYKRKDPRDNFFLNCKKKVLF